MVERDIPVFVYWNGRIKDGPDGPFYEGSTLRVIRVKRKTKFVNLLNELHCITGLDKQNLQPSLVGRYPTVVQQAMVKYMRLPVVDDSSLETMLEIPTLHPSISNVELYVEVKPVSDEVIEPKFRSLPAANHRINPSNNRSSSGERSACQSSHQEEAPVMDLSGIQQPTEPAADNVFGDTQGNGRLSDNEENFDMCGDSDDDMGDEDVSLLEFRDFKTNSLGENICTKKTMDGPDVGSSKNKGLASDVSSTVPKLSLAPTSWLHDRELRKGMVFKDKEELKKVVKSYSIKRRREYDVERSSTSSYALRCKRRSECRCRWKLVASKMKRHGLFEITRYIGPHTCAATESDRGPKQLDSKFLAEEIERLVKAEPSISIAHLNKQVKEKFGHTVVYARMWHAKQRALAAIFGDWDRSFEVLPSFMAALQKSNGTIVEWLFDPLLDSNTASFRRMFWAFSQSIEGFTYCRPLICVDAVDLLGKYKGKLMIATGIDANDQLFPLAFAITEEESFDSWRWFLSHIREKVTQRRGLCLITNSHPDILAAVNQAGSQWEEPWAYHRFCLRHLCSKFDEVFHHKQLKEFVYKAGSAHHPGKFDSYMSDIEKIKPEARRWLDAIPMAQWALVHDGGKRYGIMTTNLPEVFGTVLKGARDLPITACVQFTFDQLKTLFEARHDLASESLNQGVTFTPHVMKKIQGYTVAANTYDVLPLEQSREIFQVITPYRDEHMQVGGKKHVVQLSEGTCTCGKWQVYKFPCSHVLAVCGRMKINGWHYAEDFYSMENYCGAYRHVFSSIPQESDQLESSDIPVLSPPPSGKRKGGRPAAVHLLNESGDFRCDRKVNCCRFCGQEGHNRATCSQRNK